MVLQESPGACLDMSWAHARHSACVSLVALIAELLFVALLGLTLPALAVASKRRFDEGRVPRGRALFLQILVQLVVVGVLATAVALVGGREMYAAPEWNAATIGGSLLFLILTAGSVPLRWRRTSREDRRRLARLLPRKSEDALPWTLLCLAAGWAEELAYRGVLTGILAGWTGSFVAGSLLSALAFGAAHAVQGWRSAVVVGAFALGFQALCVASGSLIPAMIVHAAYDLIAGAAYARLAARDDRKGAGDSEERGPELVQLARTPREAAAGGGAQDAASAAEGENQRETGGAEMHEHEYEHESGAGPEKGPEEP